MADSKISALTAASIAADANEFAINEAGTSKKLTASLLATYMMNASRIHGADIASAGTIDLDAATGDLVDVTGTTAITAITLANGRERIIRFTGALTLTHGASLVLPGGANIVTAAGDFATVRGYASSIVRVVQFQRASASPSFGRIEWPAASMESPNVSDWAVNAFATLVADTVKAGQTVREFDDAVEEGVGGTVTVPTGCVSVILRYLSRAQTAPLTTARIITPRWYVRSITDLFAAPSWSAAVALTSLDFTVAGGVTWVYDSQTVSLSTLGLTAGQSADWQLTRKLDTPGSTILVGNWLLRSFSMEFI